MSHFTVLVVGKDAEKQLAPFDENDREQFIDEEEEYLKEYGTKMISAVIFADGRKFTKYDEEMKKHWKRDGIGISSKDEFIVPAGAELKEIVANEMYATFETFMKEWHGMERDEEFNKYGSRRNPKAKWDWYELGGRWTGFFKLKSKDNKGTSLNQDHLEDLSYRYGVTKSVIKQLVIAINKGSEATDEFNKKNPIRGGYQLEKEIKELLTIKYEGAKVGRPGLMTDLAGPGYVDSAKVKDIDFDAMIKEKEDKARTRYETVERLLGGSIPQMTMFWKDMITEGGKFSHLTIEEKRNLYHNQAAKIIVNKASQNPELSKDDRSLLVWLDLEDYQVSKEEYVAKAGRNALSTFAVLKDGEWFEKGEMGWFGMAHNEMDQDKWNEEFMKLLKSLPGDTVISVYDCHI